MATLADRPIRLWLNWLMLLCFIPALSIWGRNWQTAINHYITPSIFSALLALMLMLFASLTAFWFYKQQDKYTLWHLLWFLPVYLIVPWFLPIAVERLHFLVFGLFGFITLRLWSWRFGLLICLMVASLDELLQWWLPDRVGDWRDVFFNTVAVLTAAIFSIVGQRK